MSRHGAPRRGADTNSSREGHPEQTGPAKAGLCYLVSNYIDYFYQSLLAVKEFLFSGSEFNLASYDGIDGIIVAEADAFAGDEFTPSLADYNVARFGYLAIVKFNS